MKKLLLSFVVLLGALATAQVGINTENPKAMLDISAKDNQKGDLRIQDVEEKSTQWLLVWDEKDQKVKRTSLSDLERDIEEDIKEDEKEDEKEDIIDKGKKNYIRDKQPDRADEIINKIKQCAPENIVFDKHFGDGKHDFVYCATTVSESGYTGVYGYLDYNRTWLNLNLGAEYANINSTNFDPTVSKTGREAHTDNRTYGSLYQWQRASDGHEFRDSEAVYNYALLAPNWRDTGSAAGKFIVSSSNWALSHDNYSSDLDLWQAGGDNNPCPSGFHVPTASEWDVFYRIVIGAHSYYVSDERMWAQDNLPNLATASLRKRGPVEFGGLGVYWSSSSYADDNDQAWSLNFRYEFSDLNNSIRAHGASVRCIKDNN